MNPTREAYILAGPTASGKSAVAHELACRIGASIVSADSMTVYIGLDIGTAKPSRKERSEVRYIGLDLVHVGQLFDVSTYLESIRSAWPVDHSPVIIVGGTGLYLRGLVEGLDPVPPPDPLLRAQAEALLRTGGVDALMRAVQKEAPDHVRALSDPSNPRRLIRAWESARATYPASAGRKRSMAVISGLVHEAGVREARIAARVSRMYEVGLLDEVSSLRAQQAEWSATARQAIGYAEAFDVLDGRCDRVTAMERTRIRTRQFAKRQMTWFRHQHEMRWIHLAADSEVDAIANAVQAEWREHGPTTLHF